MRPLLALVGIFKDEEASIRPLLESVRGVVDHFTLLDTGSTDKTVEAITEFRVADNDWLRAEPFTPYAGLPGRNIIDFAATRNRTLELEQQRSEPAVFTLSMSGDEVLEEGHVLRAFLESKRDAADGAYHVHIRDRQSQTWPFPRVLRTDAKWRYSFPIHEIPMGPELEVATECVSGCGLFYQGGDPKRFFKRLVEVDLPVLTHMASAPVETHFDHMRRARAIRFLAQTHQRIGHELPETPESGRYTHLYAAMSYYRRRFEMEGDPSEVYHALLRYLNLAESLHVYDSQEMITRLEPLAKLAPELPEVRYMLAVHAANVDLRQGVFLALESAKVAREAREKSLPLPWDMRIEWLSYRIAAQCAKEQKKPMEMRQFAQKGVAAGGPSDVFADYLGAA